jgi:hypothetical protein
MDRLVLPSGLKQRLVGDLDKRLDLDIDQMLETPKLRLQLSPAELDKRLLELYKNVAEGPSGDVLRNFVGGNEVALQDLYLKKQAAKERARNPGSRGKLSFGPVHAVGEDSDEKRTASQWVNLALRRNLPKSDVGNVPSSDEKKDKTTMTLDKVRSPYSAQIQTFAKTPLPGQFCPTLSRKTTHSLLI